MVDFTLISGPANGRALNADEFVTLVKDLIHQGLVPMPVMLCVGELPLHSLLDVRYGESSDGIKRAYAGTDVAALANSIRAWYGKEHLCAVFEAFDVKNQDIKQWLAKAGANGMFGIYGLAGATEIDLPDEMDRRGPFRFQTFVSCYGGWIPDTFVKSPVQRWLKKHFGAKLAEGRAVV